MFFSPVYKAEESEEFYEDQPYLYYDLHIHELDYKHMERCVSDEEYKNHTDCENFTYPDFSGSVYMRREYSSEESEKFRELLIKSYKISLLDKEYIQNVNSVLTSVAEGTTDADKGIKNIANLTRTYDGKAKMFLDYEVTASEVVTLDMITWVRENFVIESMTDGVPRGVMSKRLTNVNETVDKEVDTSEKLREIEDEITREHYDRQTTTQGGPTLEINGVQAVWSNWEFESVGPTSHLLGGVSSQTDNRLWIGQWMHVEFPNATHTPGNHTLKFEWTDEDFTGKETNFHVSLGYGEVFTNITTESTDFWPHQDDNRYKPPFEWFGFAASNGTVGKFEATFGQGFPDYGSHDWYEAAEYAETLTYEGVNGHLATITSKEEAEKIHSLLDGHSYWLGGFQNLSSPDYSEPSGGWEWVTGEKFNHSIWPSCQEDPNNPCAYDEIYYAEPNDSGSEECLEVWGFDKYLNDARCHYWTWKGIVVEYEMNGTNHYEALIPQWEWDEKNGTDILTYVNPVPLTDEERNEILKEDGDPDADDDGIVDAFDNDDDNDGIEDEEDMDDDNDGIDDDNDRCPGTKVGDQVDEDGCSASQIIGELSDNDGSLPSLSFVVSIIAVLGLAILRKPRL